MSNHGDNQAVYLVRNHALIACAAFELAVVHGLLGILADNAEPHEQAAFHTCMGVIQRLCNATAQVRSGHLPVPYAELAARVDRRLAEITHCAVADGARTGEVSQSQAPWTES